MLTIAVTQNVNISFIKLRRNAMRKHEKEILEKWQIFVKASKTKRTTLMDRFLARYHFSRKFKGIEADVKFSILRGYSKTFHVFLAYAAFETLVMAIDQLAKRPGGPISVDFKISINSYEMFDDGIALALSNIKGLPKLLIEHAGNSQKLVQIKEFFDVQYTERELSSDKIAKLRLDLTESNNLLVIARAIHDMVSKGQLSPNGANAVSTKDGKALERLAKHVESHCQEIFAHYVAMIHDKYLSA
jgi:hypothetical protein